MSGSIVVTRDRYDEARCQRCGHGAIPHTTTRCDSRFAPTFGGPTRPCDCPGWLRDPDWPPPIIVQGAAVRAAEMR